MNATTIELQAQAYPTMRKAIEAARIGGRTAIRLRGRNCVAAQADVDRLAAAGAAFAYLCDVRLPDGTNRIVMVPVN